MIGAGIGGLAAALALSARDIPALVFEQAGAPGGKIRAIPSACGPVDCGPTVLTLLAHFEELFEELGESLSDHVALVREPLLARHFWPDGSRLDLFSDRDASIEAVREFSGDRSATEFVRFCAQAATLLERFEGPIMRAPEISARSVARAALGGGPGLLGTLAVPRTLRQAAQAAFSDPRLAQVFGRYATYVGGVPGQSPAILSLIWAAEERGVWRVEGGLTALAEALRRLAEARGVDFRFGTAISRIDCTGGRIGGVVTSEGAGHPATSIVFNGDPAALHQGLLGEAVRGAVDRDATRPRALSALVWAGTATAEGPPLAHHNVFFGTDPASEFGPLERGDLPEDPTLYVCAQDRGNQALPPQGVERFEIIMNAPPLQDRGQAPQWGDEEKSRWQEKTLTWLARRGLRLSPTPDASVLLTPACFATAYPGSAGSLYGRSPHGLLASFRRPTVRSRIPGLYLAGGGVHPGPGMPMALLSGRHAAEAIATDRISTSTSRRTATPGGMSTESPTRATGRSR